LQHKKCKGNTKYIVLEEGDNRYKVKAFFPFRKSKEMELCIAASEVKVLRTFNLSNEIQFGQSRWWWNRVNFAHFALGLRRFSLDMLPKIRVKAIPRIYSSFYRYYQMLSKLNSKGIQYSGIENRGNRIEKQLLVKTYRFHPSRYNLAIQEFKKNKENIIN
jgi:hypothetical protein